MSIVYGPLEKGDKIMTRYVRNKIKALSYSNEDEREYIRDLMWLEEFVKNGGPNSLGGAYAFHSLKNAYPEEYLELQKEMKGLKINVKKALQRKKQAERKAEQRQKERETRERQQDQKNWLRLGGQP